MAASVFKCAVAEPAGYAVGYAGPTKHRPPQRLADCFGLSGCFGDKGSPQSVAGVRDSVRGTPRLHDCEGPF